MKKCKMCQETLSPFKKGEFCGKFCKDYYAYMLRENERLRSEL